MDGYSLCDTDKMESYWFFSNTEDFGVHVVRSFTFLSPDIIQGQV